MKSPFSVAIAGATGLTGGLCLQRLLLDPRISKVVAIGRRAPPVTHPKLSFSPIVDGRLAETVAVDHFISCLGTTIRDAGSQEKFREVDLLLPVALGTQLRAAGCQSASVVSAMGANPESKIFYNRTKGEMEGAMEKIGFDSLAILRPSLIVGNRKHPRAAELFGAKVFSVLNPFLVGPFRNLRSIHADDIARALVLLAIEPPPGVRIFPSEKMKSLPSGSRHSPEN